MRKGRMAGLCRRRSTREGRFPVYKVRKGSLKMKSKNPGSQLKPRKGQLATRKSAAKQEAANAPQQAANPDLQEALDEEIDDQDLDLDGLMRPVAASFSTARRKIEQYREEKALRDAIEDSFFDTHDWAGAEELQARSGL